MTFHGPLYFCLFLALWSGLVAGGFKAFSDFIPAALLRAKPASGIEAMQQINIAVLRSEFVAAIFSIALLSSLFGLSSLFNFEGHGRLLLVLAPQVYLPSVFLMTIF